jgi:hypothetical protein
MDALPRALGGFRFLFVTIDTVTPPVLWQLQYIYSALYSTYTVVAIVQT